LWEGQVGLLPSVERPVLLPDGDRLVLHDSLAEGWKPGRPVALLVHGLSGSHASGYMRRVASLLLRRGVRAIRMDLRGCGRGAALSRKTYNGASSHDVRAAVEHIQRECEASPLALLGFSLGGNIVLKLAGEAVDAPLPQLTCVVVVAPPIDLVRCAALI